MLDERKAAILRAVVEEYIETAQPVGSGHVAPAVNVSSATVRNELATLEQEGYLLQPHTSAGRVPTEKGYRYFVDSLAGPGTLGATQVQQVRSFFATAHGELEQMLHDTSRLLSDLTDHTAVVVGPPHEAATVRSVQLVGLGSGVALAVVVLSNGSIEKRTLDLTDEHVEERLPAVTAHLSAHLVGRSVPSLNGYVAPATGDKRTDQLTTRVIAALTGTPDNEPEQVFVGGASRMASAFDAVETVRQVLGILEQQYVVVTVLRDVLDRGLQVAIGTETGLEMLAECSLVVAPYMVDGEQAGSIGVLGPTRMNYPQALAAVAVVSKRLGRRLTEG
ncbi:MAG: heat-inducible transcriptional repressor [Acidimicrobiaceae bacterium]|jgi:heat-inducible transcriptional repressor